MIEKAKKKAAANDGNDLRAVCTELPKIWSDMSISTMSRPTNTNEVSLEGSLPPRSIHPSLDVIRST